MKSRNYVRMCLGTAVCAGSLVISGCDNAGQGALSGAAIGAGAGAIIGSFTGSAGTGAAIGAAGGAVGGAVIGDQNERRTNQSNYSQRRDW